MESPRRIVSRSRRALRRAVDIPCELISRYVDQPLLYWATDLSPFGIWVETTTPMQMGEIVVLSFEPPAGWRNRGLTVFAEVTRVNANRRRHSAADTGMGLEFCDLTCHEHRALQGWLRGRPPPLPRRKRRNAEFERALPPPRYAVN